MAKTQPFFYFRQVAEKGRTAVEVFSKLLGYKKRADGSKRPIMHAGCYVEFSVVGSPSRVFFT
jgi:hypothetical protein